MPLVGGTSNDVSLMYLNKQVLSILISQSNKNDIFGYSYPSYNHLGQKIIITLVLSY